MSIPREILNSECCCKLKPRVDHSNLPFSKTSSLPSFLFNLHLFIYLQNAQEIKQVKRRSRTVALGTKQLLKTLLDKKACNKLQWYKPKSKRSHLLYLSILLVLRHMIFSISYGEKGLIPFAAPYTVDSR